MPPVKEVNTQGFRPFFKRDWTLDLSLNFKSICVIISLLAHQILTCSPPKLSSVSFSPRCIIRQTTVSWLFLRVGFMSTVPLHLITSCLEASQGRVKGLFCLSTFRGENVCVLWAGLLPALLSWVEMEFLAVPCQLSYLKAIEVGEVLRWCVVGWGDDSSLQRFVGSSLPQAVVTADEIWAQLRHTRFLGEYVSILQRHRWAAAVKSQHCAGNQKVVLLLQERGGKSASRPLLLLIS